MTYGIDSINLNFFRHWFIFSAFTTTMSIVPVTFELDLSLDTILEVDKVYLVYTHGMFDRELGVEVLRLLHLVRNWMDGVETELSVDILTYMGMDILARFPENRWLENLKYTFERLFMLKTCLYGYGAGAA